MSDSFPLPRRNTAMLDFLATRRSNLAKVMTDPGPDAQTLEKILTIGTRVPDHRKLTPWRLQVYQGEARRHFGTVLADIYHQDNPDHPDERRQFEADRFLRAPLIIAVISAPVDCVRGTPKWEQQLSTGAVCMTLCLAAQAAGFGAQWLTEWYAYDPRVQAHMGMTPGEQVAGFIYIGTPTQPATPRTRPDLSDVVTHV
jgi:nitroreductase